MNAAPPPIDGSWALFLDFDGTLVEIVDHPQQVQLSSELPSLLEAAAQRLNGALAVISGRSIDALDRLFAPLRLPVAGVHGLERRDAGGRWHCAPDVAERLAPVKVVLDGFIDAHPGVFYEDKGTALAVHYRAAPAAAGAVAGLLEAQCRALGEGFQVKLGKAVAELKPTGYDKGTAVAAFASEAPFVGRRPAFVGDDLTDEDAFRMVNGLGGVSVRVGECARTEARYGLASVEETLAWLSRLVSRTG